MGYVPCFCIVCAGPIGHGYGLDGALEGFAEDHGPDVKWGLDLKSMEWLLKMKVIHDDESSDSITTPILDYEDFGGVGHGEKYYALNPIGWSENFAGDDDGGCAGIPIHSECLPILVSKLSAKEKTLKDFLRAYHGDVLGRWEHLESLEEGTDAAEAHQEEQGIVLNALLPGIDYGDGVLAKCDQFYEFHPNCEWLVCSPNDSDHDEWATRNKARIENTVEHIINTLL